MRCIDVILAGALTGCLVAYTELCRAMASYLGHVSLTGFDSLLFWMTVYCLVGGGCGAVLFWITRRLIPKQLQFIPSTAVVITSDHGEALGEKLFMGHGPSLQEEVIRVPLMVHWPGLSARYSISRRPVSLVNLHGSLCEYLGVPEVASGAQTLATATYPIRSEFLFWGGFAQAGGGRQWSPLVCAYDGDTKLVFEPGEPAELYDLGRDPQESSVISIDESPPGKALLQELLQSVSDDAQRAEAIEPEVDQMRQQQLKELGYIE